MATVALHQPLRIILYTAPPKHNTLLEEDKDEDKDEELENRKEDCKRKREDMKMKWLNLTTDGNKEQRRGKRKMEACGGE